MSTRSFEAKYHGRCGNGCGGIRPGDEVAFTSVHGGELAHVDCDPVDDLAIVRPPCSRCFMVPAASGACGC